MIGAIEKRKMGNNKDKKKTKKVGKIGKSDLPDSRLGAIEFNSPSLLEERKRGEHPPSKELFLRKGVDKGFFFGGLGQYEKKEFIGLPLGAEGNIIAVGGCGSGKSSGIGMPTLITWGGRMCVTDIKGELHKFYEKYSSIMFYRGYRVRDSIIFDPMNKDGPCYDPFWLPDRDCEKNLYTNIQEIAYAIIPTIPGDREPFWTDTERNILEAALLYYFKLGLSFSQAMSMIAGQPLSELCDCLKNCGDVSVTAIVGEAGAMKAEALASLDTGLRNKINVFVLDSDIAHAFRGSREGARTFTWDDLEAYNIFLCVPPDKIEQWGAVINLLYTQLIRYFERQPEKYCMEANAVPTLLLMDEFARFGKLEMITAALATLRSKNVNICLMVQSIAQLDKIYGADERRIIFDNCQYQAILRANDADSQKYLSELIGKRVYRQHSIGETLDASEKNIGYNQQISEITDWAIAPHKLAELNDIILVSPYGSYRLDKYFPCDNLENCKLLPSHKMLSLTVEASIDMPINLDYSYTSENEEAKVLSFAERFTEASSRVYSSKIKNGVSEKCHEESGEDFLNKEIAMYVRMYLPNLIKPAKGSATDISSQLEDLESLLRGLADNPHLVKQLIESHDDQSGATKFTPPNV